MPLPPACPRIDYNELDYLTQVDDPERVERIGDRLESVGIPACVQTVTVRSEARRTSQTYRIFVPAEQIELAKWVAFEEPAFVDSHLPLSGEHVDAIFSHGKPLARDYHTMTDEALDE